MVVEKSTRKIRKKKSALGSDVLQSFVEKAGKPVILEVERPEDPIKERRISFYQRHGFHPSQKPYIPPTYEGGQKSVPNYLIELGGNLLGDDFGIVKPELYSTCYCCNIE